MAPMWPAYYSKCGLLVYVIDVSAAAAQISIACSTLLTAVGHPDLANRRIVVCLNKIDLTADTSSIDAIKEQLRLHDTELWSGHNVQVCMSLSVYMSIHTYTTHIFMYQLKCECMHGSIIWLP